MDTLHTAAPTEAQIASDSLGILEGLGATRVPSRSVPELLNELTDAIGQNSEAQGVVADLMAALEKQTAAPDLDDIQERLLTLVGHFQCADSVLYNLQDVPEELQPASIVLHRATEELDRLHNELDCWNSTHVYRQKTEADREAAAAKSTEGMTPEEREQYRVNIGLPAEPPQRIASGAPGLPGALASYLMDQQERARELQETLQMLAERLADEGACVAAGCVRVARDLNNGLDSSALRRVLEDAAA